MIETLREAASEYGCDHISTENRIEGEEWQFRARNRSVIAVVHGIFDAIICARRLPLQIVTEGVTLRVIRKKEGNAN